MDFLEYFKNKNLKKVPGERLHFEQKTTPDLIWCVANVIYELTEKDKNLVFSDKDIRESKTFNSLMQDYFSKAPQEQAENEYNKVSSYQLGLLAYAGILEIVQGRPKKYKVKDQKVISFLSVNDLNSLKFLSEYTEKFLADNGLIHFFEQYKKTPNQDNHLKAKEAYWEWAKVNTGVRGDDRRHTYRVFNKIFNIYCYKHRIPGEDASNITSGPCPYSFLIYNRTNFRDKDMPSGMTRQQYKEDILSEIEESGFVETLLQKAKEAVRLKYGNESEIKDPAFGYMPNSGVHVHHILPKHSYAEFSLAKENLITLTPGQHLSFAHVEANTRSINPDFQKICIKQKFKNIKASLENSENFYDLKVFIGVLNTIFKKSLKEESSIQEVETFVNSI